MEAVSKYEAQEPLDKTARYMKDNFRLLNHKIKQDRQETDKDFQLTNQATQIAELRQMIDVERQQTENQYNQVGNQISAQVLELQR